MIIPFNFEDQHIMMNGQSSKEIKLKGVIPATKLE